MRQAGAALLPHTSGHHFLLLWQASFGKQEAVTTHQNLIYCSAYFFQYLKLMVSYVVSDFAVLLQQLKLRGNNMSFRETWTGWSSGYSTA